MAAIQENTRLLRAVLEGQDAAKTAAAAAAAAALAAGTAPKRPPAQKRKRNQQQQQGRASGGEESGEESGGEDDGVQVQRRRAPRVKTPLKTDTKTVQGRHTTQLRNHMRKWYDFIKFFKTMANDAEVEVCDFYPTDEQAAIEEAPPRPGRIGEELGEHQCQRADPRIYCQSVAEP
jgi:hypothetical protein